jgi:hypothetical protein
MAVYQNCDSVSVPCVFVVLRSFYIGNCKDKLV